jgi:hypothetical protein
MPELDMDAEFIPIGGAVLNSMSCFPVIDMDASSKVSIIEVIKANAIIPLPTLDIFSLVQVANMPSSSTINMSATPVQRILFVPVEASGYVNGIDDLNRMLVNLSSISAKSSLIIEDAVGAQYMDINITTPYMSIGGMTVSVAMTEVVMGVGSKATLFLDKAVGSLVLDVNLEAAGILNHMFVVVDTASIIGLQAEAHVGAVTLAYKGERRLRMEVTLSSYAVTVEVGE